jgi:pyranose oxidase
MDQTIETDVLVVGSGPIGCAFARSMAEAGRQVLMVDAGAQHSRRPGEHLKNAFVYQRRLDSFTPIVQGLLQPLSVPTGAASVAQLDPISYRAVGKIRNAQNPLQDPAKNLPGAAVAYGVGGMFSHWTSNTPRHHEKIERIDFIDDGEWDSLYDRAELLLDTHVDIYSGAIRHTIVKEALQHHYGDRLERPVQELPVAGHRREDNDELVHFTGADTVLGQLVDSLSHDLDARAGLTLLPEHRARRLATEGDRIVYAEIDNLKEWKTLRVEAEVFILACGFLTPQVLWNSNIRPQALGRYITEHPLAFAQIVLREEIVNKIREDDRFVDRVATVEADDDVPIPMNDPPPMVWIPVSEGRPWHCQVHRDSFAYGELPADIDDRLVVDLRWFGMVQPNPNNRVTFADGLNDTFGMPKPIFEFSLSADDRRRCHLMMNDLCDAAGALGGFLPGAEPRFMPLGSSLHFMGPFRMGEEDDGTCVTDPWSRMWEFDNLYLGGNGLIPTSTASNPTLTSLALALRAADRILEARGPDHGR